MNLGQNSIAIVGGRGYVGQALFAQCRSRSIEAWVVGRQSAMEASAAKIPAPYRSSKSDLVEAIRGASTVLHVATVSTPALAERNPALDVENISFTLALLDACRKARTRHLVFMSSGGTVYGEAHEPLSELSPTHPICSYGIAKLTCEHYLRAATQPGVLDVTILRVSNVYGGSQFKKGDQGVVGYLRQAIAQDQPVVLLGDTVRDYLYLDDLLSAFERAIASPSGFRLYNISTGVGTSLVELTKMMYALMHKDPKMTVGERRPFDLAYNVLKNDRARKELSWSPSFAVEEGLKAYLSAFPSQHLSSK